jgi:hypothetical protein
MKYKGAHVPEWLASATAIVFLVAFGAIAIQMLREYLGI